jgi:hypothetical protein
MCGFVYVLVFVISVLVFTVFCIVSFMYMFSYFRCLYCHRVTTQMQLIIIIIIIIYTVYAPHMKGRNSSVGIATEYGLDGSEIESCWGRDFSHTSLPALGPTQPPVKGGYQVFPGGKAAGS